MRCPKCKFENTKVVDSRETNENREIRRRRECEKCDFRFTTFEKYSLANFAVIKKNGVNEPYQREKIERGIWRALEKRNVAPEKVTEMINSLEEEWQSQGKEIKSGIIGESIMRRLRDFDEVAYIRFASVYRDFKDTKSFEKELEKLK